MRKGFLVVVGVVFVLALATSAVAAEKTAAKTMKAWGTVTAVDATAKTVTIKEKSGDVTFKFADNAKVMASGKTMTFADLKANEHVSVHYTVSGSDKVASEIFVSMHHTMAKTTTKKN